MSFLLSLGGLSGGSIFRPAGWVDLKKRPGETSMSGQLFFQPWNVVRTILMTPNLMWLLLSAALYVLAPYDMEAAGRWDGAWFARRCGVNTLVIYLYFGWWHFVSHFLSRRKYAPHSYPSLATMVQNVWYTTLGALQWSAWEMAYYHLLAEGRVPYDTDEEAWFSWWTTMGYNNDNSTTALTTFLWNVMWVLAIPLYRDFHFYFAHRTIHYRALYKYVHSLHHRNIDIEPFAGLSMHPLEHVYYYSAVAVSLYFKMSPFVFHWNGWHLNLAPAAGHSGWEDHWQADQYHYLHHAKFECNYGGPQYCLDCVFGTFREKLGVSEEYKGEGGTGVDNNNKKKTKKEDEEEEDVVPVSSKYLQIDKGLLNFYPTSPDHILFWAYTIASLHALYEGAIYGPHIDPRLLGLNLVVGPALVGFVLMRLFGDRTRFLWPFHKESLLTLVFHVLGALLFVIVPTYHMVVTTLMIEPTASAYCLFRKC
eukprot:TRINITY_DN3255_c0_g2_i1.p1 TRINITY_DN3255_c0_g2~~TRINITY_DN3255_c0_g2_i1.p1  ORF type:complete len:478 (+),score=130.19 TRINITY_DN3255_c0_g2_i1:48-1481(+)